MAVAASAIWRVRPSGSNANGGGYDSASYPGGTDYSQQNAAQASGTHGTASGTTAFSDTVASAFTAAMVGNALYLTGAGLTTGWYFVTAYTSATAVTLDRSPGTGTVGTWTLGGGWADFWTNPTNGAAPVVPGNTLYILGTTIPNKASYHYDYDASGGYQGFPSGNWTGFIRYLADPASTSYGAGGYPTVKTLGLLWYTGDFSYIAGLWFVGSSGSYGSYGLVAVNNFEIIGCVLDQYGYDICLCGTTKGVGFNIIGNEVFSSVSGAAGSQYAIRGSLNYSGQGFICGNNIHDTIGNGIYASDSGSTTVDSNIIAKVAGDALYVSSPTYGTMVIKNNTIDAPKGHGIVLTQGGLETAACYNNIISNVTQSGKYAMTVTAGTSAANKLLRGFTDYNTFYNNTTNYNAISAGAHDTALSTDPYVSSATEDYTLKSGVLTYANAFPGAPFPSH